MTTYNVSSGHTSSGITLGTNDVMNVEVGGTALATILDGGTMTVLGTASGTVIQGANQMLVTSGGRAIGTTISNGVQVVQTGGTATSTTTIQGEQDVFSGGITISTTIDTAQEFGVGGNLVGQTVGVGGTASATTISSGEQDVTSGGIATGTIIDRDGVEMVFNSGVVNGATVDGGKLDITGGTVSGIIVVSSGVAEFETPAGSGATISFGGAASLFIADLASAPGGVQRQDFNVPIAGLIDGDLISFDTFELGNVSGITNATPGAFNSSTDTTPLAVISGGTTIATLTLDGNYAGDTFKVSPVVNDTVTIGMHLPPVVTEALVDDTGVSPIDDITSDAEVTGGGDPGATVTISANGTVLGTTTADSSGIWTFTPSLPDGFYVMVASETNVAGTGSASLGVTLDTTPPALVNDGGLSVAVSAKAPISEVALRFDDNLSDHTQETYTVVTPPAHGEVLLNGSPASKFTQSQIDAGQVAYLETAFAGLSDSFGFTVSDVAGNTTATEQFNIAVMHPRPLLVSDSPLSVAVGATATITESLLRFDDSVATHVQETYTIVTPPANGTLLKNGSPTVSFTQADIDNGSISYQENVAGMASDTFSFTVSDSAGNTTGLQQFQIVVQPNPPRMLFAPAQLGVASFGDAPSAGGWTGQTLYPRLLGNVNGDGLADIVGFGAAGAYVSIATGNGNFAQPFLGVANFGSSAAGGGWISQDAYPRELADVNGDGLADIIGFGASGVYVSLNAGGGNFAPPTAAGGFAQAGGWTSQNLYPREMADVNGDGMPDIVGFGASDVYISTNLGNDQFSFNSPIALQGFGPAQGWFSQQQFPREMAVLTNSGLPDIVGFGSAGVYVSRNLGNDTFAQPVLALDAFGAAGGWTGQDVTPRFVADINGDGLADIVGFGSDGVWVSMNLGNGNFAQPVFGFNEFGSSATGGGWTNQSLYPRELADVTGDKRADIVGFGANGVYVSPSLDPIPGALLT